jgi:DNA-binding LytR/AlgR family response regulator
VDSGFHFNPASFIAMVTGMDRFWYYLDEMHHPAIIKNPDRKKEIMNLPALQ